MRRIYLIYFFIGLAAVIVQSVLLRELLVVVLGNEIVFGVSLGHWLLAVFAGALAGGWISGRTRHPVVLFTGSILAMALTPHVSVTLCRYLYRLSGTPAGAYIPFLKVVLLGALVMMPFAFFVGFTFPLAARLGTGAVARKVGGGDAGFGVPHVASIYIAEAGGALLGGSVFSFFLAGSVDAYNVISLAVAPLLVMMLYDALRQRQRLSFVFLGLTVFVVILSLTPAGNAELEKKTIAVRWKGFSSGPSLCLSRDSRYQNISVGFMYGQYFFYSNGKFSTRAPEENDNLVLAARIMTQHPSPSRLLVVGEVMSGLGKYLLRYNIQSLTSVEMDEEYIDVIRGFLAADDKQILSDPRFFLQIEDGRRFISRSTNRAGVGIGKMDLIFIYAPQPSTLLSNRFYTVECFHDIAALLADDGMLALRISSSENYLAGLAGDYAGIIYNTLKRVFPYVAVAAGEEIFFFCSRSEGVVTCDPVVLEERYRRCGVEPANLGLLFRSLYPPQKTRLLKEALQRFPGKIVNSDGRPMAVHLYNKILGWDGTGESGISALYFLLGLAALFFVSRLCVVMSNAKHRSHTMDVVAGVAIAGFAGISLELLLINAFQNVFGYVYQFIGLIIALFMVGLPFGAWISRRWLEKNKTNTDAFKLGFLAGLQILLATAALGIPVVLRLSVRGGTAGGILLLSLVVVVGFLVGAVFPLSLQLTLGTIEYNIGRSAGIVDAADHLGASVGAFFCGGLLLPLAGLRVTGYMLAGCCIASAALLVLQAVGFRRRR